MPGSITKEFPLETIDQMIQSAQGEMSYDDFRAHGAQHIHRDVPAIVKERFLVLDDDEVIEYDLFLSLANQEGLDTPRLRKIMYFVFAMRDHRIRRFITERIAGQNGRWRVGQLVNKTNANFFQEFFEEAPARKARSNFERFLVEAGIFDEDSNTINLDLSDGWLVDAMRVAAQHEPNARRRRLMVNDPMQFLVRNNLHALANATKEELLALTTGDTAIGEEDPLEDDVIEPEEPTQDISQSWNRNRPRAGDRANAQANINHVARERAAISHWELENLLAEIARSVELDPQHNTCIDMHFTLDEEGDGIVLAEMKSCHRRNLHAQVRKGISQLLEYRYRFEEQLGEGIILLLLLETRPTNSKSWLIDYAESLGILIAWRDENRFVTTATIPPGLGRIVMPVE